MGWGIDLSRIVAATPFNSIGFQMASSREACAETPTMRDRPDGKAPSNLASGHITLQDAAEYLHTLPNLEGVAAGVSKDHEPKETFQLLWTKPSNAASTDGQAAKA